MKYLLTVLSGKSVTHGRSAFKAAEEVSDLWNSLFPRVRSEVTCRSWFHVWVFAAVVVSVLVNQVIWFNGLRMGEDHLLMHKEYFPKRAAPTKAEGKNTACQAAWWDQLMHCCRAGGTVGRWCFYFMWARSLFSEAVGGGNQYSALHWSNLRPGKFLQKPATKMRGYPETDRSSVLSRAVAGVCSEEQVFIPICHLCCVWIWAIVFMVGFLSPGHSSSMAIAESHQLLPHTYPQML